MLIKHGFTALALVTIWIAACLLAGCGGGGDGSVPAPAASDAAAVGADSPATAAAVVADEDGRARVLVGFRHAPGASDRQLIESVGGRVKASYRIIPALAANLPEKAVAALRRNPNVAYVEGDAKMQALEDDLPWGIDRVDAEVVWGGVQGATSLTAESVTGEGVKVAIIDSGIDAAHIDLAGNYAGGVNCITGGSAADDNGHGTHCAGTVAAMDNALGVIGVAPKVRLYAVKVLDSSGSGYYSDFIEGLQWAVDNGMQVASMSLGGTTDSISLRLACDAAYAGNVLVVAAAGNSGSGTDTVAYPAKYDSVIAVAATDSADNRAYFSSTGPSIELAAPGVGIVSTVPGGSWASKSGTSMACPHVTGVAALIIHGGVTAAASVRQVLQSTATDLGAAGRDPSFGFGLVNAAAAVQSGPVVIDEAPTVNLTAPAQGATVEGTVPLLAEASDDRGLTAVEFLVDGALVGTDGSGADGWSCAWDSTSVADGAHTVTAVAVDSAGQRATDSRGITVQNQPVVVDGPPTVNLTAPAQGATVEGTVPLLAEAADDRGLAAVEFFVDDALVGTDGSGADGWSCTWDSTSVADGAHTVTAVAVDSAGQRATDSHGITVQNLPPAPATGALNGKVTRDAKPPKAIGGAVLTAVNSATGETFTSTADAKGSYEMTGVPVGTYSVTASAPGYVSRTQTATIVAGGNLRLSFSLPPA